jgi:hypothetical protein
MENKECPSGKQMLDKMGAVSLKNLTMKLHHIEMNIYECKMCGKWHLATKGKNHKKFRHHLVARW